MLATHAIEELVKEGYQVKAMLRDKKKYQLGPDSNVELFQGDILDRRAVELAVKGCDLLLHSAAITAPDIPKYSVYHRINVTGTETLLKAAATARIKKAIYVSSANTIGHGTIEEPGRETDEAKPPFKDSYYAKSKRVAQDVALSFADKMKVVVVNPSFMIGAYDTKLGSNRIILMGYNKKIVFYPPGGKNFVNTRDVAKGIVSAFEKGKNGECYLLAGENMTYRSFFEKLRKKSDRDTSLLRIPPWLLLGLGHFAEIPRKLKIKTPFSVQNMQILCTSNFYDNGKARDELGVSFRPIDKGIEEAVEWFRNNGFL